MTKADRFLPQCKPSNAKVGRNLFFFPMTREDCAERISGHHDAVIKATGRDCPHAHLIVTI